MYDLIKLLGILGLMLGYLALGALLAKWSFEYHDVQRWEPTPTECIVIDPFAKVPEKIEVSM